MTLTARRAEDILKSFAEHRILVVGDLMWDRYIYGTVSRISPEAPVPVVAVTREHQMPGGASNVAWNVQTLGGQAAACGILGRDDAARELKVFFAGEGIEANGALEFDEVRTTVKTRIVAENQQVVRVDWDTPSAFGPDVMQALCAVAEREIDRSSGVVIEDYGKGVVQQQVVDTVLAAAGKKGIPVGFDPKDNHDLNVTGVTVATPNRREAYHAVGVAEPRSASDPLQDASLLEVGRALLEKWSPQQLLITLGPQGMLLLESGAEPRHVHTRAREVFDVSGAGDTVIAACVLSLAAGAEFGEAAEIANYAAGVVVGHVGTASCTPDEVLQSVGP